VVNFGKLDPKSSIFKYKLVLYSKFDNPNGDYLSSTKPTKPILLSIKAKILTKTEPRNTSEKPKELLTIDRTISVSCERYNVACKTALFAEFQPRDGVHHLIKIDSITLTEKG